MDINPRRLRVLGAVALRGGVADAAQLLHLTPSAVSQQLRAGAGAARGQPPLPARLAVERLLDDEVSGHDPGAVATTDPVHRRSRRCALDREPPVLPLLARADAAPRAVAVAPVPGVGFRRLNMIYRAASAGPGPVVRAVMDALRRVAAPANPAAVP